MCNQQAGRRNSFLSYQIGSAHLEGLHGHVSRRGRKLNFGSACKGGQCVSLPTCRSISAIFAVLGSAATRTPTACYYSISREAPICWASLRRLDDYREEPGDGVMSVTGLLGFCGTPDAAGATGVTDDFWAAIDVGSGRPCG